MSEPRLVEVRRSVLKQNDVIARALREQFRAAGVFVVSLVSSPGSGKTTFLETPGCSLAIESRRWWEIWRLRMTRCDWPAARLR